MTQPSWHSPDELVEVTDSRQGQFRLRCWHQQHFRAAPNHPMQLILLERLDEEGNPRVA